jgi:hypothetical protein
MTNINQLAGAAIGVLMLVVVFSVIPLIGSEVDEATGDLAADSDWNSSYNADIPTGTDLWEDTGGMISLAAVIIIVGFVLSAIMYFRKGDSGGF